MPTTVVCSRCGRSFWRTPTYRCHLRSTVLPERNAARGLRRPMARRRRHRQLDGGASLLRQPGSGHISSAERSMFHGLDEVEYTRQVGTLRRRPRHHRISSLVAASSPPAVAINTSSVRRWLVSSGRHHHGGHHADVARPPARRRRSV